MLRLRDVLAALAAIWVSRWAWDDPTEPVAATAHLAWYLGRTVTNQKKEGTRYLNPVSLDVDGDGAAETLVSAVYYEAQQQPDGGGWTLQILDLQPTTRQDKTHPAPFAPAVLYESAPVQLEGTVNMDDVQPIALTTGHVKLYGNNNSSLENDAPALLSSNDHSKYNGKTIDDRTRHYFCGHDWHDASQRCATPCTGGQADECPTGERCFADTPCDVVQFMNNAKHKQSSSSSKSSPNTLDGLYVTPAGTLPCIFTLWSSGTLTMHALTAPADQGKKLSKRAAPKLQILPQWHTPLMRGNQRPYAWSDLHVTYLDAIDAGRRDGLVLVQAAVDFFPHTATNTADRLDTKLFLMALDGWTGELVWETDVLKSYADTQAELENTPGPVQPGTSGTTSTARRRSQLPHDGGGSESTVVPPCLHHYRRSFLTSGALPYLYWGDEDAVVQALHFETQPSGAKTHAKQQPRHHHHHHHKRHPHHHTHRGKPNVVVSKTHRGLQVRSLRNGQSLCHVSLWHETLYADLNHDGVLDATFIMTGKHRLPGKDEAAELNEDEKWIYKLMLRVVEEEEARLSSAAHRRHHELHHVCHSMTLSGIPPREELFSAPLCEADHEQNEALPDETEAGPPLAVESMRGKGYDLVLAVNNGLLHRVRNNGRKQWELKSHHGQDFPIWEDGSVVRLDRIDAARVTPSTRPIVLTGDTSLALVAPRTGRLLHTATFPQPVVSRPVLVDFNGDGTTDVIVATADAFWGYQVHVATGSSVFFRIIVGLLLMGVMLAILRNKFGPRPGKRSTDLW